MWLVLTKEFSLISGSLGWSTRDRPASDVSNWCEVHCSFWGDSGTTATLAFFSADKHTRPKHPHTTDTPLSVIYRAHLPSPFGLCHFSCLYHKGGTATSLFIFIIALQLLFVLISLFLFFFSVSFCVSCSWCRCCWCRCCWFSAWRQRKPRPYKRWMITSEEALFPCVPEWARRKQEDEAKFK